LNASKTSLNVVLRSRADLPWSISSLAFQPVRILGKVWYDEPKGYGNGNGEGPFQDEYSTTSTMSSQAVHFANRTGQQATEGAGLHG
jgi:hypothetical protein